MYLSIILQGQELVKELPLDKIGTIGVFQIVMMLIVVVAFVYIIKLLIGKIK